MPLYKYKVSDQAGKIKEVLIEGDSHQDSLNRLRQREFVPVEFLGELGSKEINKGFTFSFQRHFDVCEFTNLLVPLLSSHIPIEKALQIISLSSSDGYFRDLVNRIRKGLHEGKKFSYMIKENESQFPRIYSTLIEAGEETGSLIEVSSVLRKYLNDRREMQNFLITSSIYPAFVISIVLVVVLLMFTIFIPKFAKIFMEMGRPMPLLTACVFWISRILSDYWLLWIGLILFFLIILFFLNKN
ncbi:MAG TPA: type II secretion system F family protein, partial [Victivallales bacterium]|nr:type II secretion system F family protein [Victivallales bacterium]